LACLLLLRCQHVQAAARVGGRLVPAACLLLRAATCGVQRAAPCGVRALINQRDVSAIDQSVIDHRAAIDVNAIDQSAARGAMWGLLCAGMSSLGVSALMNQGHLWGCPDESGFVGPAAVHDWQWVGRATRTTSLFPLQASPSGPAGRLYSHIPHLFLPPRAAPAGQPPQSMLQCTRGSGLTPPLCTRTHTHTHTHAHTHTHTHLLHPQASPCRACCSGCATPRPPSTSRTLTHPCSAATDGGGCLAS